MVNHICRLSVNYVQCVINIGISLNRNNNSSQFCGTHGSDFRTLCQVLCNAAAAAWCCIGVPHLLCGSDCGRHCLLSWLEFCIVWHTHCVLKSFYKRRVKICISMCVYCAVQYGLTHHHLTVQLSGWLLAVLCFVGVLYPTQLRVVVTRLWRQKFITAAYFRVLNCSEVKFAKLSCVTIFSNWK
jgi:hypothetical protein